MYTARPSRVLLPENADVMSFNVHQALVTEQIKTKPVNGFYMYMYTIVVTIAYANNDLI